MRCKQNVGAQGSEGCNELSLEIGVQVNIRFIDYEKRCRLIHHHECQHLAPHLKTEAGPKYFSVYSFLRTKHVEQGFLVRIVDFRLLDVHPRPCRLDERTKFVEGFWIVMPDVSKVSGGSMG